MNKKGSLLGVVDNIQFIMVLVIILSLIIMGVWGAATLGPIVVGEGSSAATNIKSAVLATHNNTSLGNATTVSADTVTSTLGKVELLVYAVFFGLFFGFLIVAYEVKFYPFLSWAWIGLMFIVVLLAMVVSNAYQEQSLTDNTAGYYATWGTTSWVMNYLPHIFATLGLISGVMLFILRTRSPDDELTTGSVNL